MIVVADASPLNYLIQIGCDGLLKPLFGAVLIPDAVAKELDHPAAPRSVAAWASNLPSWVEVRTISVSPDESLSTLDIGEREAILLAEEIHADLLLIDEKRGRLEARNRGIPTTGTLGVLLFAEDRGLVDAAAAFARLISLTSFRATADLRAAFLSRCKKPR